jgi:DNA repair photolyase
MAGGVRYIEIEARGVTRVARHTDPWFVSRYGMNLYRGCEHACVYCDGRAEKYHVEGDFGREIAVKVNAVKLLHRELSRIRETGFVFIGGGVSDAYQPAEERYRLARGALQVALELGLPVHVLTKSGLVARDLDLLERINRRSRAILSFSIQTLDEQVRRRFEPGAAPIARRFELLAEARARGLGTGVMAIPVLPGISDRPQEIDALVGHTAALGLDFLCFGGLTLRPGRQLEGYLDLISECYPQHLEGYRRLYRQRRASGSGDWRYYERLERRHADAAARHGLPGRIPRALFSGLVPLYTEVAVLLEHREFSARQAGQRRVPRLGRAGHVIQQWARGRLAKNRRRAYDWRSVEREFSQLLADGSLRNLEGMTRAALAAVEELVEGR